MKTQQKLMNEIYLVPNACRVSENKENTEKKILFYNWLLIFEYISCWIETTTKKKQINWPGNIFADRSINNAMKIRIVFDWFQIEIDDWVVYLP